MKRRIISVALRLAAALAAAAALGIILVPVTFRQRGYLAVGGEWLLIGWIALLVMWLTAEEGR